MRGDYFVSAGVDNKLEVVTGLEKVYCGCLDYHTKFFCGCGLEVASNQEPMVFTMSLKLLLEGIFLKDINVRD